MTLPAIIKKTLEKAKRFQVNTFFGQKKNAEHFRQDNSVVDNWIFQPRWKDCVAIELMTIINSVRDKQTKVTWSNY